MTYNQHSLSRQIARHRLPHLSRPATPLDTGAFNIQYAFEIIKNMSFNFN